MIWVEALSKHPELFIWGMRHRGGWRCTWKVTAGVQPWQRSLLTRHIIGTGSPKSVRNQRIKAFFTLKAATEEGCSMLAIVVHI